MKRAAISLALLLVGCSRRAEIENAPQGGQVPVEEVPRPADGVPLVEDAPQHRHPAAAVRRTLGRREHQAALPPESS